jgi:acyl carrier protein
MDIEKRIKGIISEISGYAIEKIDNEMVLNEELNMDEMDMTELVTTLEEEFNLIIPDEVAKALFIEVNDVIEYVKEQREGK